jgi:AcrR family transcriptional regulator
VTERTYFRHFPDKREVVFDGDAETRTALVEAVSNASARMSPLPTLLEAFLSVVPMLESDRTVKELRHRIIAATPELRERDQLKWALLTEALTGALERREVPQGLASLAAACGTAVLTCVRLQWLSGSERGYATLLTDAFDDLGLLVAGRG